MSYTLRLIKKEKKRQKKYIELIASENFVSKNILKAIGSCLTNKYAEGYPAVRPTGNKGRYYGGTKIVDEIEQYCCEKWQQVFNTDFHCNVQPHSGSSANLAAYAAVLKPNDTILTMSLENGGHLTHGSPVNQSGKLYNAVYYGCDDEGEIDYHDFYEKIITHKPKLIVAGASAYSREIPFDFLRFLIDEATKKLADENYHPYFMVDMAHIAGLVAAGWHISPFNFADIITTTTHKTLRGARGGIIFCRKELAKKIDSAVFPGTQGGPLLNHIAGKAVCAEEALTDKYKKYIGEVVKNSKAMADEFQKLGYSIVSGGTDTHLFLIDLRSKFPKMSGKDAQEILEEYGIGVNKNCVPRENRSPKFASGIRIGTAAMTTKGFDEQKFRKVARDIDRYLKAWYIKSFHSNL